MLPVKRFTEIGTPFHGLVIDGTLTLPNSATMTWPAVASAFTQVLRNSTGAANAPTRTTEQQTADTAAGRQWLDYALRNGSRFNGRVVSSWDWILYPDPAGNVWLIENRFVSSSTQARPRLYVVGLFGRVHYGITPPNLTCDRLIYSADITPTDSASVGVDNYYTHSLLQNEDGNKALLRVYRTMLGASWAQRYMWDLYVTNQQDAGTRLSDLYEITISGTGSLEPGHIGEGISASASLVANFSTLHTDTSTSTTAISEATIQAKCTGPFGSVTWQIDVGGTAQGATFAGSNVNDIIFSAKLNAYYGAADAIEYVERSYSSEHDYTANVSASSSISNDGVTTTICRSLDGSTTEDDVVQMSASNGAVTITGELWSRTITGAGPGETCEQYPVGGSEGICPSIVIMGLDFSTLETGTQEESEVYVSSVAGHGLILVAQGYDDSGVHRYTRTVVAPDGNTLTIDPADAPMTYSKMRPDGIAWHPVTGQIVWYPGQKVGFV